MWSTAEGIFAEAVRWGALLLEAAGAAIVLVTAARCLWRLLKRREPVKVLLAEGLQTALTFLLAAEVLHTVLVRDLRALALLAGTMAVRAAVTLLLHWELRQEKGER